MRSSRRRRSVGLRQLPGVGHQLPAAAAQLHGAAPDPVGATGVRVALPAHGGADDAGRSPRGSCARTRRQAELAGLADRSRRLHTSPNELPPAIVAMICELFIDTVNHRGRLANRNLMVVKGISAKFRAHRAHVNGRLRSQRWPQMRPVEPVAVRGARRWQLVQAGGVTELWPSPTSKLRQADDSAGTDGVRGENPVFIAARYASTCVFGRSIRAVRSSRSASAADGAGCHGEDGTNAVPR